MTIRICPYLELGLSPGAAVGVSFRRGLSWSAVQGGALQPSPERVPYWR